MPKKNASWGTSSKVTESRERKAEKKRQEVEAKEKAIQDAYWKDDNKQEQKKKKRKEDDERKKQEHLARKQEAKKLLEEEEAKLVSKAAKGGTSVKKVTRTEIEKRKELEHQQLLEIEKLKNGKKNKIDENPIMEEQNPNQLMAAILRKEGGIEARNVDDAISVLNINSNEKIDIHPEKRMKAAYKEFEEMNLPILKNENPSLRLTQLKQMLWKDWQKSPDNPLNHQ